MMEERPDELEQLVVEAEDNGRLLDALRLNERLLLALQRYHPDPSEPVDMQKIRLCECILRFEESEEVHQLAKLSCSTSAAAAGGHRVNRSADSSRLSVVNSSSSTSKSGRSKSRKDHQQQQADLLARHAPLLTDALSLQGLLAFGDRLLSDDNVLEATQHNPRLIRARARILQSLATLLYKQKRPRAGVPLAQASLKKYKQLLQPPNYVSTEVVKSYLGLCTVLSASNKHKEALQCVVTALEMTEVLEAEFLANSPASAENNDDGGNIDETNATGKKPHTDGCPTPVLLFTYPPPKRRFVGPLEAACYHNAAVELEHLGLQELALVCYRSGCEVASHSLGEQHPLTQSLHKTQLDLFVALNFKHFYPDGRRPGERSTAFDDPERALKQLNYSYVSSNRHKEALLRDDARARAFLQQAADPLCAMSFSISPSASLPVD